MYSLVVFPLLIAAPLCAGARDPVRKSKSLGAKSSEGGVWGTSTLKCGVSVDFRGILKRLKNLLERECDQEDLIA